MTDMHDDDALKTLEAAVRIRSFLGGIGTDDLVHFLRHEASDQAAAIDALTASCVQSLTTCGWSPDDMYEHARRKVPPHVLTHLLQVIASETLQHPAPTVDPRWSAQLRGASPSAGCTEWMRRSGLGWDAGCTALVDLLAALHAQPRLTRLLDPPGAWRGIASAAGTADERILRKVRALLAKAESTEFDGEADALTAKAQELMSTYSIERALVDADEQQRTTPDARRIWLDAPYTEAKWLLVSQVARSNHCECVFSKHLGVTTLVGFATDLDATELLSTSLLVQAVRAMGSAGGRRGPGDSARTRSFRKSFLVAFAHRVGERLRATAGAAEAAADTARGGSLLPVLAAREREVSEAVATMFPRTRSSTLTVHDAEGWGAGRDAADRASLDVQRRIGRVG